MAIPFTARLVRSHTRSLLLSLMLGAGLASTAMADPGEVTGLPVVASQTSGVSRAEVIADLMLWRRAGAEALSRGALYGMNFPEYEQAVARYQALRQGPAFAEEVARVKGEASAVHASR